MNFKNRKTLNSDEIAKLAGLSRSTVSRVINNYPNVNDDTRNKVLKIIEEHGYTPNISARVLAGKRVDTLGLFFIKNSSNSSDFADDTHADFMLACLSESASQNGFLTLTYIIRDMDDPESERRIKEIFSEGRIDAGIFIGCLNYVPVIEELIAKGFTVGILDQYIPDRNEPNRIVVNFDDDCAEKAVDYLASLNHKNIMAVHGDLRRYNGFQKYNSFLNGMTKNNLQIRKEWLLFSRFDRGSAFEAMSEFLRTNHKLPTAVFCANDNIAFGVMNAIKSHNLKIPDDISVIGVDDSSFSSLLTPSLTTFRVDFQKMLKTLISKVIEHVTNSSSGHVNIKFGSELVIRDSCRTL